MARRAGAPRRGKVQQRRAGGPTPSRAEQHPTAERSERTPGPDAESGDPQALVVTHRLDPGEMGDPYTATIRIRGTRSGAGLRPTPRDTFIRDTTVRNVVPGAGPIAVTSWIYGIEPGDWKIAAELAEPMDRRRDPGPSLSRAGWSWRNWAIANAPDLPVRTRWALLAPLARRPAVVPGSFTALAVLGIGAAFVVQSALLDRLGLSVANGILVSLLAVVVGLAGAKLWHMVLQGQPWRESIARGWSVDGFLVVAPIVALGSALVLGIPIGAFLDSATPGVYVAVAIGRLGCFFTGCCAGRPTRSRFGIRSSDRSVVARRIPTQLMESLTGLVIAVVTWLAIAAGVSAGEGFVFVVALVAYVIARQGLLRLREESRAFSWRRSESARPANP